MIVGVRVSDAATDFKELTAGIGVVRKWCGKRPERVLADGGYASRENVTSMAAHHIEFIAPWKDEANREAGAAQLAGREAAFRKSAFRVLNEETLICPAGKQLGKCGERKHHGLPHILYKAAAVDCGECKDRDRCCGKRPGPRRIERIRETAVMQSYLERMQLPETQEQYRKRGEVAEFPNLWIKSYWGLRRFTLRGKAKVTKEAIWAALAYDIQQWTRLKWLAKAA
jgi:hypothetical protein